MANTKTTQPSFDQLTTLLDEYLVKKAPALPTNAKEAIVQFAPWVTLIIMIIALPGVLFLLGLGTLLAPFAFLGGVGGGMSYTLSMIILAVSIVLEALALPGLFHRTRQGWNFVYYSSLLSIVSSIVAFNIGSIVMSIVALYFLFQVRSYYK